MRSRLAAALDAPPASSARSRLSLDQLDPVAVRIAYEAESRAALPHSVGRPLGVDAVGRQLLEGAVEVLYRESDVVVAGAELIRVDAVVVGQLEHRVLSGQPHEHVDRLVADRHPRPLLESELLVERDRAVDVADAVAGVEVGRHSGHECDNSGAWGERAG